MKDDGYHETRFKHNPNRLTVWSILVKAHFQKYVPTGGSVLELGAGFCDFINQINASKKFAIDVWSDFVGYANNDVIPIVGKANNLQLIQDNSIDLVFASNLFEHMTQEEFSECLTAIQKKLKPNGKLVIMQPNYRYAASEYFDDYTHKSIWTHISLVDFLNVNGFRVLKTKSRFLPLSLKSKLPQWKIFIWLYVKLPFKPFGKQMLVVAQSK